MRVKFFVIPALDPDAGEAEVNDFLAKHRLGSMERQYLSRPEGAFWLLAINYLEGASPSSKPASGRDKIDYKAVLEPADFEVFAALRSLRKQVAEGDGVPLYAIFTNQQLATMAQQRTATIEDLRQLEGVGSARAANYGAAFLAAIARFAPTEKASAASSNQELGRDDASPRDPP